jgi:DNA-binding PadR family transcriptional regulator
MRQRQLTKALYIEFDTEDDAMPPGSPRRPLPGRVLGLYALATLDREGSAYGYSLADRVATKTEGAWRPGPGAIYPALQGLVARGAAREQKVGVRRVYSITPEGRALLRRIRREMAGRRSGGPDLSLLWAEIAGTTDPGRFMLQRLRRQLDALETLLTREPNAPIGSGSLREATVTELTSAIQRLRTTPGGRRRT